MRQWLIEARSLIDDYGPVHHPGRYDRLIDGMDAAIKVAGEEVT